jgi:hypothetical protein
MQLFREQTHEGQSEIASIDKTFANSQEEIAFQVLVKLYTIAYEEV